MTRLFGGGASRRYFAVYVINLLHNPLRPLHSCRDHQPRAWALACVEQIFGRFQVTCDQDSGDDAQYAFTTFVRVGRTPASLLFRLRNSLPNLRRAIMRRDMKTEVINALRHWTPHFTVTLSNLAAILGMLLGTAGFVMSLMNYLRDKPRVRVVLQWDMKDTGTGAMMGLVRVSNVGRRPVFISAVALEVPKGFEYSHLVLMDAVAGKKLGEGDAPAVFMVKYDADLNKYSRVWRDLRGYVEDSAGGEYRSKKLPKNPVPSWARQ